MSTGAAPLVVLHACPQWLPRTQTWMHTQVRFLPLSIDCRVAAHTSANLDQFAVPGLRCRAAEPWPRRLGDRLAAVAGRDVHTAFLARAARAAGARVIHSHFAHEAWHDLAAVRELDARHVVSVYGWDASHLPRSDRRWPARLAELFARVDRVLCEGPCLAAAVAALGCPADRLRLHHLGVDLDRLPFRPRRRQAGEPLRVLMAAAFREKKGIPEGLRALGRLAGTTALEVTLVGDAADDAPGRAERARIERAVAASGLGSRLARPGFLSPERLQAEALGHHLFLAPSQTAADGDSEGGLPVCLIELAATGLPVVSTTHADIPQLIADGGGGWLAPERDAEALHARLAAAAASPALWEPFARRTRERIEREYDARRQGERLAAIYLELGR